MSSDRKTIGLTKSNQFALQKIIEEKLFKDGIDAAKFAMSLAINSEIEPNYTDKAETVWNIGSFDSEGELRDLISTLYPDTETPYRLLEYLINSGFEIISKYIEDNGYIDIEDLLELTKSSKMI